MKPLYRFQLDGLIDGFVQVTFVDDGLKNQIRVTPRKMLGVVAQLQKVDDKNIRTVSLSVEGFNKQFKISQAEARKLASEVNELMKWKR